MRWAEVAWAAVLVGLGGCGRIAFDAVADATGDATGEAAAARCDIATPFAPPVPIAELNTATADDGTLRLFPDELSGYFWSARGDGSSHLLYVATRATAAAPFDVAPVRGLANTSGYLDPTVPADGTFLAYRYNEDIWLSARLAPDLVTAGAEVAALSSPQGDEQISLQPDGDRVFLASSRSGNGDDDLWTTTRDGSAFATPTRVDELSGSDNEGDPALSADGLTLYFRSDRPAAHAGYNVFVARRTTPTGVFDPPVEVGELNSAGDDGPSWLSLDQCRLYLSSNRAGTNDIYLATRAP
jgi:hypothetical protein